VRLRLVVAALLACGACFATAQAATAPQLLRLNGIGPLRLGMERSAALNTGWLCGEAGTAGEESGDDEPKPHAPSVSAKVLNPKLAR
jgi:hypothetical protein